MSMLPLTDSNTNDSLVPSIRSSILAQRKSFVLDLQSLDRCTSGRVHPGYYTLPKLLLQERRASVASRLLLDGYADD